MALTLDLETSIHNKGNPHDERNFVVSAHLKEENKPTICKFYDEPDFLTVVRDMVARASLIVGVNLKFDVNHLRNLKIELPDGCRVWDCMLAEFILSGQTNSFASLEELAENVYKCGKKNHDVEEYWEKGISTEHIPRDLVESRGNDDVDLTWAVYNRQLADGRINPALHRLVLLDGLDLRVLSDMEANGFKYDTEKSLKRAEELEKELNEINQELLSYSPIPINLDSGDQLSYYLYGGSYTQELRTPVVKTYKSGPHKGEEYVRNEYQGESITRFDGFFTPVKGSELKKSTEHNRIYATGEDTLLQLKAKTKLQKRILHLLSRRAFLSKLCGTYLVPFPKLIEDMHWKDNLIHGQFNQVVARTGRLSSSRPNMQNSPEEVDEFFVTRFN